MNIHLIAAARPNFMKIAPLWHALKRAPWARPFLVHTGQHYDPNMSAVFFEQLGLAAPDAHLGVGSGSHAEQTAGVMLAYDKLCAESRPDWVVVVGDVNSTAACTLVAVKRGIPVGHLEAGLRSNDRSMPEEINRLVTDSLADLLWTPSADADANLAREGVYPNRVECVGNIMIDSYEMQKNAIADARQAELMGLAKGGYGVVTLHRPSNVDDLDMLARIIDRLGKIAADIPLVLPLHPRTRARLEAGGLLEKAKSKLRLIEPLGYIPFMNLVVNSRLVVTDSGGVQEETTYLDIPCLTLRRNTERPVTITLGSNELVTLEDMEKKVAQVLDNRWKHATRPPLWDGKTADRVVASLERHR